MGVRSVAERAALERKLYQVPHLREAMRERRISYEKARLIARHADEASIEAWIERAEHIPCITLRRQLQHSEDRRMCARGEFEVWAPRRVAAVIALAFSAALARPPDDGFPPASVSPGSRSTSSRSGSLR
jgi:hypothetical protein